MKEVNKKIQLKLFARIIAGFMLAPVIGPLIYYALLNIQHLFGNGSIVSFPDSISFLTAGILISASLFYAPAVLFSLAVMLFILRRYMWNIGASIVGAVVSGSMVAFLFFILLLFAGWGVSVAYAGFFIMAKLIIVSSLIAGISFWLITVYRNDSLEVIFETAAA